MRAALRHLLPVLLAINLVMGLLHGASMTLAGMNANAVHLSPHEHCAGFTDKSDPAAPQAPADDERHTKSMLPGCPLAHVAAIDPFFLSDALYQAGIVISLQPLPSLISADPRLLDPPPRAFLA
jgi:hypothetical protein